MTFRARLDRLWWDATCQLVGGAAFLICGYRTSGRERVPREGGLIVASNHASYVDPPLVGAAIPRVMHFLAKEELFRNRLFGALIRHYHALPIRRGELLPAQRTQVVALLSAGGALLMFPEGTRSRSGSPGHPRPGVGIFARDAQVPVLPVHISGARHWHRGWIGGARIRVRIGEPLAPPRPEADREEIGRFVEELMLRIWALGGVGSPAPQEAASPPSQKR